MGSSMDSRYWVCPVCCKQYDWDTHRNEILKHACKKKPVQETAVQRPDEKK